MKTIRLMPAIITLLFTNPVLASDPVSSPQSEPVSGSHVITWVLIGLLILAALIIIFNAVRKDVSISDKLREERLSNHGSESAKIAAILLASLIALMTFLLTVGVQSRVEGFTFELYTALVLLGTVLVLYSVVSTVREFALKGTSLWVRAFTGLRQLQQLIFIGSVFAVAWFAISYSQLVTAPPPTPEPQTNQPSAEQPQDPAQPPPETQPAPPPPAQ